MNFGEKLFNLRKEKGLSQEALAEQLNTTRQAISKWENNHGYPETEKLLKLSDIFQVPVDFLLKETTGIENQNSGNIYVTREMAVSYLSSESMVNRYFGLGTAAWLLGGIPYNMLPDGDPLKTPGIAVFLLAGICIWIVGAFKENDTHKILKQEPLILDHVFYQELSAQYMQIKKRYQVAATVSALLLAVCITFIAIDAKGYIGTAVYHIFIFIGLSLGAFGFIQSVGKIDMYELLIHNEQYCSRIWFKLMKKVRDRINNL